MPRQKTRQASFTSLPLVGPGFLGLNTELEDTSGQDNGALWATELVNIVFTKGGKLSMRKGLVAKAGIIDGEESEPEV